MHSSGAPGSKSEVVSRAPQFKLRTLEASLHGRMAEQPSHPCWDSLVSNLVRAEHDEYKHARLDH
eukprot:15447370-Alexandrium_andersonii.AAC.1